MTVAIVGAGYAGLALAWHCAQKKLSVTLFDPGSGASRVSTGLLHPAPGRKATPCWRSDEGMEASLELLRAASQEKPVFTQNGILRFAVDEAQERQFGAKTLWMPEGITVYSNLYLQRLHKGVKCEKRKIAHLNELDGFDAIIIAAGAETLQFADLPLKRTIGQSLICRCPEPLSMSLLGSGHITPTADPELCQVGSTYEHTEKPDPKKALALLDQVALFYPQAKEFKVVEILSGVRVSPKVGYRPLIQKIGPKTWVFTGLGSRGLLYHALLAKELASALFVS